MLPNTLSQDTWTLLAICCSVTRLSTMMISSTVFAVCSVTTVWGCPDRSSSFTHDCPCPFIWLNHVNLGVVNKMHTWVLFDFFYVWRVRKYIRWKVIKSFKWITIFFELLYGDCFCSWWSSSGTDVFLSSFFWGAIGCRWGVWGRFAWCSWSLPLAHFLLLV